MQDWGTLQLTRFASQRANNGFDYRIDNHSVFTIATRYVLHNDRFPGKVFILVLRTVTSKFLSVNYSVLTIKKNSLLSKNNLVTRWARSGEKEPTMDINHSENDHFTAVVIFQISLKCFLVANINIHTRSSLVNIPFSVVKEAITILIWHHFAFQHFSV